MVRGRHFPHTVSELFFSVLVVVVLAATTAAILLTTFFYSTAHRWFLPFHHYRRWVHRISILTTLSAILWTGLHTGGFGFLVPDPEIQRYNATLLLLVSTAAAAAEGEGEGEDVASIADGQAS